MTDTDLALLLETEIDRAGMVGMLDLILEICQEKAEHVRSNWQDESLARGWEKVAKAIAKVQTVARNELP